MILYACMILDAYIYICTSEYICVYCVSIYLHMYPEFDISVQIVVIHQREASQLLDFQESARDHRCAVHSTVEEKTQRLKAERSRKKGSAGQALEAMAHKNR